MYLEEILQRVENVVGYPPKRVGSGYSCHCPAHDDKTPSFSISEGNDRKILLHCHAGCNTEDICTALQINVSDLFSEPLKMEMDANSKVEYIYTDENGNPLYKKVRTPDKKFYILSHSSKAVWEKSLKGKQRVLYKLPELLEAKRHNKNVFVVEGEKDADRLQLGGLVATTPVEGAGSRLRNEYASQLEGCHVVILYDEDPAGHQRRDQWKRLLAGKAASIRIIKLPELEFQKKGGADVSDWLKMGHTTAELLQLVKQQAPFKMEEDQDHENGLIAVNLHDFLKQEIPPREMILDPIIPSQGLSMLYSKRGVGKTFLSLALGHAVATGTDILRWKSPKAMKVLYVDGEMPASLIQERLRKLVVGKNAELPAPSYFRLITPDLQEKGIPDISTSRGQQLLEAVIGDAQLLILDNLSTLTPSLQENEADSWAPLQTWILKMRRQGVSVLLVHHAGKGGQQRGTSRREDVLDAVMVLKNAEGHLATTGATFEVHFEKARGFCGDDAEPFIASLETSSEGFLFWNMKHIKDDLYDEVVEGIQNGKSYRGLAQELEISKSKVEGIVKKARAKGDLQKVEK